MSKLDRVAKVVLAGLLAPAALANSSTYHLEKTVKLTGDMGWDYLTMDSQAKRLFITRDSRVSVISLDKGGEIAEIAGTSGAHGVALAPDLGRGFISNGKLASVTIFDMKTLRVSGTVPTEQKPDAIIYQPAGKRVVAFNGDSKSATVIDPEKGSGLGAIKLAGKPEFAAADPSGKVFVNIEDKNSLAVIDPVAMKVDAVWSIAPCDEPTGLALDSEHHRLFAVCGNQKLVAVDAMTGKVVAQVPIGKGPDAAVFDAVTGQVFSSNGADGTMTVIHEDSPDHYTVVATVPTRKGARTMAFDPATQHAYLVTAEFKEAAKNAAQSPHRHREIVPGSVVLLVVGR